MTIIPSVTLAMLSVPAVLSTYIAQQMDRLDGHVEVDLEAAVAEFQDGDYFMNFAEGILIFGQVEKEAPVPPDLEVLASLPPEDAEDLMIEFQGEVEMYEELHKGGYLFGTCYSVMCPDGEMGSTHVLNVTVKIDKAMFDRAKANGWRHWAVTN
jgi:hypothetical protein